MGQHLDAHIQRYVDGRIGILEFRDCFLSEVLADATQQRINQRNAEAYTRAFIAIGTALGGDERPRAGLMTPLPTEHAPITPEEMLAALEPAKVGAKPTHEPTLYELWDALAGQCWHGIAMLLEGATLIVGGMLRVLWWLLCLPHLLLVEWPRKWTGDTKLPPAP